MSATSGPADFPDWGRYVNQAAFMLENTGSVPFTGPVTLGPFYVGAFQTLALLVGTSGSVTNSQTTAVWANDMGGANVIAASEFQLDGNATLATMLSVLGNWVSIELSGTAYPAGFHVATLLQAFTWRPASVDLIAGNNCGSTLSFAVPAGGTVVLPTGHACDGHLTAAVNSTQQGVGLEVEAWFQGLGWFPIMAVIGSSFADTVEGDVPATPLRVVGTNGNAAAADIQVSYTYGRR